MAWNIEGLTGDALRQLLKRLRTHLSQQDTPANIPLNQLQEAMARSLGHTDWHALQAWERNTASKKTAPGQPTDPTAWDHVNLLRTLAQSLDPQATPERYGDCWRARWHQQPERVQNLARAVWEGRSPTASLREEMSSMDSAELNGFADVLEAVLVALPLNAPKAARSEWTRLTAALWDPLWTTPKTPFCDPMRPASQTPLNGNRSRLIGQWLRLVPPYESWWTIDAVRHLENHLRASTNVDWPEVLSGRLTLNGDSTGGLSGVNLERLLAWLCSHFKLVSCEPRPDPM